MKTVIMYDSKYGATKTIAQRLQSLLQCDCIGFEEANNEDYDCYILGGPAYAGMLSGKIKKYLEANPNLVKEKNVYLFNAGLTMGKEEIKKMYEENFKDTLNDIKGYDCLGGTLDFTKMNFMEKTIIKMINKKAQLFDKKEKGVVDLIDEERIVAFVNLIQKHD